MHVARARHLALLPRAVTVCPASTLRILDRHHVLPALAAATPLPGLLAVALVLPASIPVALAAVPVLPAVPVSTLPRALLHAPSASLASTR
jgi:hypothetical protein